MMWESSVDSRNDNDQDERKDTTESKFVRRLAQGNKEYQGKSETYLASSPYVWIWFEESMTSRHPHVIYQLIIERRTRAVVAGIGSAYECNYSGYWLCL